MRSKYYKSIFSLRLDTNNFLRIGFCLRKSLNTMDWLSKYEENTELYSDANRRMAKEQRRISLANGY